MERRITMTKLLMGPLAEGSLLDNTIILYGCGTSKTHVGRNCPLVLAADKNHGLKQHGAFHRSEEARPQPQDIHSI